MMSTIHELRKQPHWSYSAFQCYLTCPMKYKFRYLEQAPAERTAVCFPFGRAIHAALTERARSGPQRKIADAKELFAAYFKAETDAAEKLVYKDGEEYDSLLAQGFRMLETALEHWQDDYTVQRVAEGFSVAIPGLQLPMIGEFDLIVADGSEEAVVDWKTSSSKWSSGKAELDLQATAFCFAYKQLHGYSPLFRFDVMTKTKTPSVDSHYTQRNEADFKRFIFLANQIERAVGAGLFYPNASVMNCTDCPYAMRCKKMDEKGV